MDAVLVLALDSAATANVLEGAMDPATPNAGYVQLYYTTYVTAGIQAPVTVTCETA